MNEFKPRRPRCAENRQYRFLRKGYRCLVRIVVTIGVRRSTL